MVVPHGAHDRRELRHLGLGQTGGRLVHQHVARLGRERTRDAEPALVTVRRATPPARPAWAASPSSSSSSVARRRASRGPAPDAERRDLDVLAHGQAAERAAVLERPREARAPAPVRGSSGHVPPVELDRARRRAVEARSSR